MTTKMLIDELQRLDPDGNKLVRLDDYEKPLIFFVGPDNEGNILLGADIRENLGGIF